MMRTLTRAPISMMWKDGLGIEDTIDSAQFSSEGNLHNTYTPMEYDRGSSSSSRLVNDYHRGMMNDGVVLM